ncbi:MAG: toll/interleukin-1 receptor domain-containing protein [Pseudonocardiaceae bacterium]
MAKVFISHSNKDQNPTAEVRRWLVAERHEVFLDQDPRDDIKLGEEWEQRLRAADAVVCVVTSAFLASPWCTQEVACARAQGSRLLPVWAEPGVDHPLLRSVHHADLTKDPTTAREVLLEALRQVDAAGGWGGRMAGRRFRDCAHLTSRIIRCSSAALARCNSSPTCCGHPPSAPNERCCW